MSGLRLLAWQSRYELKSYWRNPASTFFTFMFPLMFLVIFASLNNGATIRFLGGLAYNQYFIPGIIAFGIISATYTQIAITLCLRRETGVLKRLRTTPVPPWAILGGLIVCAFVVSALMTALTTALGMVAYGVEFPGHWVALLVALAVGAATFCALGVAVSTLIPNADAAPAVVNGVFFPILFLSGTFFPVAPGSTVGQIASVFPIQHFNLAVFTAFDPRLPSGPAHGFAWGDIGVMLLWAAGAAIVAVRRFRWDSRR